MKNYLKQEYNKHQQNLHKADYNPLIEHINSEHVYRLEETGDPDILIVHKPPGVCKTCRNKYGVINHDEVPYSSKKGLSICLKCDNFSGENLDKYIKEVLHE